MKISAPKISRPNPKSWTLAGIVALILGGLVLLDNGSVSPDGGLAAACRIEVTAGILNVRSEPSPNAVTTVVLHRGDLRGAETTVRDGYRQLVDGGWVLDNFIRPLPGSKCAAEV